MIQKNRAISLLLGLVGLISGCRDSEEAKKEKEAPQADVAQLSHNTNGEAVLKISPEIQQRIALVVKPLESAELSPELKGLGAVLDPAPLIQLQGDMAATKVSLQSLKIAVERARSLFEKGETVARKSLEASETDFRLAELKLQASRRQLTLDWGEKIAKMDDEQLKNLVDSLILGRILLIRIDLGAGDTITGAPISARVSGLQNGHWDNALIVSEAPKIDPRIQGRGFILSLENAESPLRIGSAVTAFLKLPGTPKKGVIIPKPSVLRTQAKTWVEVQDAQGQFTRREVVLENPIDGGWFSTTAFAPEEKVVVEGAQILLSEEQKSQLSAD